MARRVSKRTLGYNSSINPNSSQAGQYNGIINRANSLIRRNVNRQQSYDSFMRNYNRIISARNNMLSNKTRSKGAVAG
ncbi:hypothetical protein [Hoylesella shahii]|uniref:Uncharacterized protein n=1 Tax=Hoylesella shahii DSM 15611 = JCM 12083 TaxID=1122991 RepID=A0A318HYN4_9BACT|nr:hypothetical protein [Hoylesella shahii]PXX23598.1 hypothetical protein EJ73_00587 [Hoylesella shahii DSM 15611 = JCM 12083]